MEKVYTVKQLCEILQLSSPTVRKLIKDGKLKKIETGWRKILVSDDQLKRFLNNK